MIWVRVGRSWSASGYARWAAGHDGASWSTGHAAWWNDASGSSRSSTPWTTSVSACACAVRAVGPLLLLLLLPCVGIVPRWLLDWPRRLCESTLGWFAGLVVPVNVAIPGLVVVVVLVGTVGHRVLSSVLCCDLWAMAVGLRRVCYHPVHGRA